MKITIRQETIHDYSQIKKVNDEAFGQENEGNLIDKLRFNPGFIPGLSIVAECNEVIIGHILFFPIKVRGVTASYESLALAPVSVKPEFQNKGIGGQLIIYGLDKARELGFHSVIVLGHKHYYPRFGFEPVGKWGINAPFDVPAEAIMALELVPDGLKGVSGTVEYPEEFDDVG